MGDVSGLGVGFESHFSKDGSQHGDSGSSSSTFSPERLFLLLKRVFWVHCLSARIIRHTH